MMDDRFKGALLTVIRAALPDLRFYVAHEYTIRRAEDGTFDAVPSDPDGGMPAVTNAPIRGSFAGNAASKLTAGTRVLVAFVGGNRYAPFLLDALEAPSELVLEATSSVEIDAPAVDLGAGARAGVVTQATLTTLLGLIAAQSTALAAFANSPAGGPATPPVQNALANAAGALATGTSAPVASASVKASA